jgi:ribosome assembly protein YihI (activator of Der GTPase)
LRRSWSVSTRSARCGDPTPRPSRGWNLADLDDLLEQLDEVEHETLGAAERIDELRGRIEVLMDEIEISLGIEPPVIASEDAGESDEEES